MLDAEFHRMILYQVAKSFRLEPNRPFSVSPQKQRMRYEHNEKKRMEKVAMILAELSNMREKDAMEFEDRMNEVTKFGWKRRRCKSYLTVQSSRSGIGCSIFRDREQRHGMSVEE